MRRFLLFAAMVAVCSCHRQTKPAPKPVTLVWHSVGSWSGRGNAQTESFEIGYEPCRVRWEARNESEPGAGELVVTLHSAVSGRDLALVVDHRGAGKDVSYVHVDPHYSYMTIESKNVDWSLTVEEGDSFSPEK